MQIGGGRVGGSWSSGIGWWLVLLSYWEKEGRGGLTWACTRADPGGGCVASHPLLEP